ncbi:hypothetical protein ACFS07_06925 [Undibacterium arcticum]
MVWAKRKASGQRELGSPDSDAFVQIVSTDVGQKRINVHCTVRSAAVGATYSIAIGVPARFGIFWRNLLPLQPISALFFCATHQK